MGARTPLIIHVKEKSLKAILRDGKAIHLSYEPHEIRDLIISQVSSTALHDYNKGSENIINISFFMFARI